MPEEFEIAGMVLKLLKALEGIKQGAHLWSELNRAAMRKIGFENTPAVVPTDVELADLFTKAVAYEVHKILVPRLFNLSEDKQAAMAARAVKLMNQFSDVVSRIA